MWKAAAPACDYGLSINSLMQLSTPCDLGEASLMFRGEP